MRHLYATHVIKQTMGDYISAAEALRRWEQRRQRTPMTLLDVLAALVPLPGKASSEWKYAAVPVLGPIAGATLAGLVIRAAAI